jgi:DMSO/TMAO reductase YedYZ heme-binding membrane subunit
VKLGRKWKRLHATTYIMSPLVLINAVFLGADFGVNRGPDVKSVPDMGALFGFLALSGVWLILFIVRKRGVRWNWKRKQHEGVSD